MLYKQISLWILLLLWSAFAQGQDSVYKQLQTQLIKVTDGGIIELPTGTYYLKKSLSMEGKNNVTIRGKGIGKTILNFKQQQAGAEGIRVTNGNNIVLEDFTVQDALGDAIKISETEGVIFRRIRTEWTGAPKATNGAYGLYPVVCHKVLVEHCQARGATEAGIYVGQSQDVIVRYCEVDQNVAGIQIENSLRVDVHHNLVNNNAMGVLVFNLPAISLTGRKIRVYQNQLYRNNFQNFASQGNYVASIPSGTGILIMAAQEVEIFENTFTNNQTVGTGITSNHTVHKRYKKYYNAYASGISIHDNTYQRGLKPTVFSRRFSGLKLKPQAVPHIIFDGVTNPAKPTQQVLCIRDNRVQDKAPLFADINISQGFKNIRYNVRAYRCSLPKLKQVWVK
ncbi:parallel beta-helix domain-containing protein [uncultured Microscilla sp.]|uniref:parallel beta-helix domain-containing protein n=1 Tax=uncultured Microscilla sp. TaxID=432653 RepID=UPI0026334151|nr:parallel beta-helix domain-containing protein [uncultured Microscilla sp.]